MGIFHLNLSKPCSNGADQGRDRLMDGWPIAEKESSFVFKLPTEKRK
jgi:hypothetical protein